MQRAGIRIARAALCAVASAQLAGNFASAARLTSTWTGGSGSWTNPAKWSTNPSFPNNDASNVYDAVIPTGTATLARPISLQQFRFGSGFQPPDLLNSSTITTNDLFTWSNGTFDGTGTIDINGGWNISYNSSAILKSNVTLNNAG